VAEISSVILHTVAVMSEHSQVGIQLSLAYSLSYSLKKEKKADRQQFDRREICDMG